MVVLLCGCVVLWLCCRVVVLLSGCVVVLLCGYVVVLLCGVMVNCWDTLFSELRKHGLYGVAGHLLLC